MKGNAFVWRAREKQGLVAGVDAWLPNGLIANLREPMILYRLHADQATMRALEEQVGRSLAVRAAARTRRATGNDPLADVEGVTAATLDALGVSRAERTRALEHEVLSWATLLADMGRRNEAEELVGRAKSSLGGRAGRAFAAAQQLRQADGLLTEGRPAAGTRGGESGSRPRRSRKHRRAPWRRCRSRASR